MEKEEFSVIRRELRQKEHSEKLGRRVSLEMRMLEQVRLMRRVKPGLRDAQTVVLNPVWVRRAFTY